MELLLNLNQYDYKDFLNSKVDTLIVGLRDFCLGYLKDYFVDELANIVKEIKKHHKKLYLSLNIIANEEKINKLSKLMNKLKSLEIDGYVISDFGILQLFKENNLITKVIFNPVTTITNKYASKIANDLGVNHVCIANELNLKDILECSQYTNGNIEILAQGYYQICNSKRPLLTNFLNKLNIKSSSPYYYIQEESRDYAYPIIELNKEILIYIDKQRCIMPYLDKIKKSKIKYLRIDTMFLDLPEVNFLIDTYIEAINDNNKIPNCITAIKEKTNSNLNCLDNVSLLIKEKKA